MLRRWLSGPKKEPGDAAAQVFRVREDQRIYAVGDIHGRDDLLNAMVKLIAHDIISQTDDRTPMIIFLGDHIDRGDHSRQVLDILMSVHQNMPDGRIRLLKGNHEAACLEFLANPARGARWFRFGGQQTLASYGVAPPSTASETSDLRRVAEELRAAMGPHVDFLRRMETSIQSGDVLFVHAGLDPALPLDDQNDDAMLWGESNFIENGGYTGLRVVHGHYDAAQPLITNRRVCVDTGAYYSGRLSAIRLDDAETILVADVLDQA